MKNVFIVVFGTIVVVIVFLLFLNSFHVLKSGKKNYIGEWSSNYYELIIEGNGACRFIKYDDDIHSGATIYRFTEVEIDDEYLIVYFGFQFFQIAKFKIDKPPVIHQTLIVKQWCLTVINLLNV